MSQGKHVEKIFCDSCESSFKIMYNEDDVYGYHKFCPYCGSELNFDDEEEQDRDE